MSRATPQWGVPRAYDVGDHVMWRGVELVCARHHYAGEAAEHPWDPGDGWLPQKAATLWAPNGPAHVIALRAVLDIGDISDRLGLVLFEAIG